MRVCDAGNAVPAKELVNVVMFCSASGSDCLADESGHAREGYANVACCPKIPGPGRYSSRISTVWHNYCASIWNLFLPFFCHSEACSICQQAEACIICT